MLRAGSLIGPFMLVLRFKSSRACRICVLTEEYVYNGVDHHNHIPSGQCWQRVVEDDESCWTDSVQTR